MAIFTDSKSDLFKAVEFLSISERGPNDSPFSFILSLTVEFFLFPNAYFDILIFFKLFNAIVFLAHK